MFSLRIGLELGRPQELKESWQDSQAQYSPHPPHVSRCEYVLENLVDIEYPSLALASTCRLGIPDVTVEPLHARQVSC